MKILHIIDSGGMYGAEKVLLSLSSEQIKLGMNPHIASIGEKGIKEKPLEQEARSVGIPVTLFRMRPGPNLFGAMQIRNYALRNNFNILHSHGYKGNILLGYMPVQLRKLPLISTLHGYTSTKGMTKIRIYEWLDRRVLPRLDAVVLVSEMMRKHLNVNGLVKTNFRIIENGIPDIKFDSKESHGQKTNQIIRFCGNNFIIGAVGRLSPEKGFHHLIGAFGELAEFLPDIRLLLLGEGERRDSLEQQIHRLGINNKVLMPGYIPNAAKIMKMFNIFALPSLTEGLPITLLEAMQQGIPTVCTRAGGIVNVIRDKENGLLVDVSDQTALAAAIKRVYHDAQLCRKLTKKARQEVREKYSSKNMALQYLDLYQQLLQK